MATALEPFPLFIDAAPPESAHYFSNISSQMSSLQMLSNTRLRKPRVSLPLKVSNYVRLRYYQYEVTFGLYMLTPGEKAILNTIILTVLSAILAALYWGFESFVVRVVCQLVWYVTGSVGRAEDLCNAMEEFGT